MSYSVNITVNLPDDVEVDLGTTEAMHFAAILRPIAHAMDNYPWTSLVVTIVNRNPPKAVQTFID